MIRLALSATALTGCNLVFPLEDVARGPVASYAFEGDVLADSSGRDHHGSCAFDNCPLPVAGRVGFGARFDGDDVIDVPYDPDFMTSDGLTVTVWIRLDPVTGGCAVSKLYGATNGNAWQLCLQDNGLAFFFSAGGEGVSASAGDTSEWHHYALRWDPKAEFKSLWIDGLVVAGLASPLPNDDTRIVFGADRNDGAASDWITGALDEIQIFDRALAPDEIVALAEPDS